MALTDEIKVKIGVETGQFKAGMNDAAKTTEATGRQMDEALNKSLQAINSKLESVGGLLRNAFAGFTVGAVTQQIVSVMSSFENLEIRLRSVMGSVEKGDEAFAWIKKFAKDTPFEVDGVTKAFMLLKNMGLDPMDGTMQAISDQAAKSGQGMQGLERVSLALGQAFTKSKLQAEEMNQLLEAGVPAWDLLAKATGKQTSELQKMAEKGMIGRDAIKALIEEMGRASAGGAGAMMASLEGQVSNFKDNVKNSLDDLRKAGGLDFLKEALGAINAKFDELNANGSLKDWAQTSAQAISAVGETLTSVASMLADTIGELVSTVVSGFKLIGQTTTAVFGGEAITGMEFFRNTLKVVEIAVLGLVTGFKVMFEVVADVVEQLVVRILRFGDAAMHALQLDFAGAKRAWDEGGAQLEEIHRRRMENIIRITKESKEKLDAIVMREPTKSGAPASQSGGGSAGSAPRRQVTFQDPTNAGDKDNSRVSKWENELLQMKSSGDRFREMERAEELRFWQEKLKMTKKGTDEQVSVQRKVLDIQQRIKKDAFDKEINDLRMQEQAVQNNAAARLAIVEKEVAAVAAAYGRDSAQFQAAEGRRVQAARQAQEQINQIKQIGIDLSAQRDLAAIEAEAQVAQFELSNKMLTQTQMLALEEQFEIRRNEIKLNAIRERLAMMDPATDPVAYAQVKAQIEQIELDHQLKLQQIRMEIAGAQDDPSMRVFDTMEQSFSSAMNGILTKSMTLRQTLNGVFKSIYASYLSEMVTKPLAMAAMRFVRESMLGRLFFGEQAALQAAASAKTVGIKGAEAAEVIGLEAGKAGAGGAAAMAGIPIIGPALAVAAAAAMFALVTGFGKGSGSTTTTTTRIPSAANGYDIPAGLNPLTQLHEREMVLPAEQADVIRGMAGGGGGGQPIQINVTAMDSRDVKRFLLDNKSAVADALKSAVRDFKR